MATKKTTKAVVAAEEVVEAVKPAKKATTSRKAAALYIEMHGKQVDIKDIQAAVKEVKGATAAYLNTEECVLYIVNAEGETVTKELA